ncbi:hypothetical protein LTR84_000296 [Exophiala bonariae]|uniref:Aflatoxin regulatory protein domain-containing protein n=1 Tax=Exophiala bonariae TaxID=1690606 RepID=A0AAV9NTV8_9EURO|nr:hypothetical protein LTR84_000296 [Exophiala bonariae]
MASFTGPSFSPPLEHSQQHSQQQKYVNNMAFDFNPTHDFSDHSNGMYSSLSTQGHMIFPLGPDDMNLDPMDIQAVFDLDFSLDDLQRGCNMPNSVDASGNAMSDALRDYIPPLSEHDDMAYSNSLQAYSEPLSKTSTNSHSNSDSRGGSGSPAMPQSRDSYDSAISMGATKSTQGMSASPPLFLPDNISLAELRCHCLQRHVQFLSHLQELLQGFDQLTLDMVLNGVDQGLKVWDLCVQCRMCQQDRNREVLLLSVTSIRTVARILQKASQRISNKQSHLDNDEQRISTTKSCADGESHSNNARFTFGSYEIKGEESWLVLGVILTRMLAKIQGVLVSFKKSLNSPNCRKGDGHAGDNSADYLHRLLEGLQANIHALSASLMGGI